MVQRFQYGTAAPLPPPYSHPPPTQPRAITPTTFTPATDLLENGAVSRVCERARRPIAKPGQVVLVAAKGLAPLNPKLNLQTRDDDDGGAGAGGRRIVVVVIGGTAGIADAIDIDP